MADYYRTHFALVASYGDDQDDYVPANGEVVELERFHGSASMNGKSLVKLVWDSAGTPEIIAATHGEAEYHLGKKITGDGSKKLSIILVNDDSNSHVLGGQWVGRITS